MSILPSENGSNYDPGKTNHAFSLDQVEVDKRLLEKDPTAGLFSTLRYMDSVENWVLARLGKDVASQEEVSDRLQRLSEIIYQYRQQIPPDNHAFLQVLAWLNFSVVVVVLDYLSNYQQAFMAQLMEYSKDTADLDVNADLMVKRVRALYRTKLLDRVYSPDNVEYVTQILLKEILQ